ncbi:protein bunched, class 2/F/G isoform [Venturia canescens]|uniref:protein bunched, class 2/F/G isoform n=1 Tax=Venturia canescens TaxID=32260 RepID=UPI001C9D2505|nr:protein bunched, class 2/F/G isoform-like [Venturia canescens]
MADNMQRKQHKPLDAGRKISMPVHRTTTETIRLGGDLIERPSQQSLGLPAQSLNSTPSLNSTQSVNSMPSLSSTPNNQCRKKTSSFQITSVTVGSRMSNDAGDDSNDDLDESHTEDNSVEHSRVTDLDVETPSYSEDTFSKEDVFFNASNSALSTAPVIPTSSQYGLAIVPSEGANNPSNSTNETHNMNAMEVNSVTDNNIINLLSSNAKQDTDIREVNSHSRNERFKVVKIESTEPFRRGRWTCMDYLDHTSVNQSNAMNAASKVTDPNEVCISYGVTESGTVVDTTKQINSLHTDENKSTSVDMNGHHTQQDVVHPAVGVTNQSSGYFVANTNLQNVQQQPPPHQQLQQHQLHQQHQQHHLHHHHHHHHHPHQLQQQHQPQQQKHLQPQQQHIQHNVHQMQPQIQLNNQQIPQYFHQQPQLPPQLQQQPHHLQGATLPSNLQPIHTNNFGQPQSMPQISIPFLTTQQTNNIITTQKSMGHSMDDPYKKIVMQNQMLPGQNVICQAPVQQTSVSVSQPNILISQHPSPQQQQKLQQQHPSHQPGMIPQNHMTQISEPINAMQGMQGIQNIHKVPQSGPQQVTTAILGQVMPMVGQMQPQPCPGNLPVQMNQIPVNCQNIVGTMIGGGPMGGGTMGVMNFHPPETEQDSVTGLVSAAQQSADTIPVESLSEATQNPDEQPVPEDTESMSGTSAVAIDNKIEQAMDLVKSHLMFAVREEVEVLKEKIAELMDRINQLEAENLILKSHAAPEILAQLSQTTTKLIQNNSGSGQ